MITISDSQRESILMQTASLMKYADTIHNTFALSNNISDKALEDWHTYIYQSQAVLENIDLQVRKIKKQHDEM